MSNGAHSYSHAGTAPTAGELNGKVSTVFPPPELVMATHQLTCIVSYIVSDHLGTGRSSK